MQAPSKDCSLCPRLYQFRQDNIALYPNFHNAPVPAFGNLDAEILVVGLAPGLKGANQTGRPFTRDYAGILLYNALLELGLAKGEYKERADDGLELINCRITNAVRCVPPQNKVTGEETSTCGQFLRDEISSMKNLKVIISLGLVSHNAVLSILGVKKSAHKFGHGNIHKIEFAGKNITLADTYHSSRYNVNTNRITYEMFLDVFKKAKALV